MVIIKIGIEYYSDKPCGRFKKMIGKLQDLFLNKKNLKVIKNNNYFNAPTSDRVKSPKHRNSSNKLSFKGILALPKEEEEEKLCPMISVNFYLFRGLQHCILIVGKVYLFQVNLLTQIAMKIKRNIKF